MNPNQTNQKPLSQDEAMKIAKQFQGMSPAQLQNMSPEDMAQLQQLQSFASANIPGAAQIMNQAAQGQMPMQGQPPMPGQQPYQMPMGNPIQPDKTMLTMQKASMGLSLLAMITSALTSLKGLFKK